MIGFAIAPIFPALMSGTSGRVSPKFAANTIGFQMMSAGIGGAILPTLMGVLARRISLETIPIFIFTLLVAMLVIYLLSMKRTRQLNLVLVAESQPAD